MALSMLAVFCEDNAIAEMTMSRMKILDIGGLKEDIFLISKFEMQKKIDFPLNINK
jgi:hypothetical protein